MAAPIKPEVAESTSAPQAPPQSIYDWREGFYSTPTGEAADSDVRPQPTAEPTQGFFDKLLHGVDGKNRLTEIGRSVPRGLANIGNAVAQGAAEVGHELSRNRIGEALDPKLKKAQDARAKQAKKTRLVSEEEMNMTYGARSDDPIAALTETVVQAAGAVALLAPAGAGAVVTGAAVDAFAFDPYEAGLSELAAQYGSKVPGIGGIIEGAGKLGSVSEQDDFITSRLKRAVEGGIVGLAFDAVFWSAKKLLAVKNGDAAAAKEADDVLDPIVNGKHTPNGAAAVARPDGNGAWKLDAVQELRTPAVPGGRPSSGVQKFNDAFDQKYNLEPGAEPIIKGADGKPLVKLKLTNKGGDIVEVVELRNLSEVRGAGRQTMTDLTQMADEHGITLSLQASPLELSGPKALQPEKLRDIYREAGFEQTKYGEANMVRRPGDVSPAFRETEAPRFSDRAEAEAQVTTLNVHIGRIKESRKAKLFSERETVKHLEIADRLLHAADETDAERLIGGTDFNFHYIGGTDRVKAQIEALSEQFRAQFDQARKTGTTNDVTIRMAKRLAKSYGIRDFAAVTGGMADEVRHLSVRLLLGNRAVEQLGEKIAKMAELRGARPHDPVLLKEARDLLNVWAPLTRDVAGVNSEVGRALQILQVRNDPRMKGVKFGKDSADDLSLAARDQSEQANIYDDLTPEEIDVALRMFQRSGGAPRNAQAVIDGLKVLTDPNRGPVGKAIERATNVFINSLISGAKTFQTIFASGNTLLHFEYMNRTLAGVLSANPKLAREGADMLWAHYKYAFENVKSAAAAFREQRSILDPSPALYATGGVVNNVITLPGRIAGTLDEFTRVTGYRAFERAKALRMAREQGLSGADLVRQVEADVKASIDAKTGVGVNPQALEFAGIPTLSDPLGAGTFGGDLSNFLAKYPASKFIVPFIRPGVNTFRYVGKASGGDAIRLLFKEQRDALLKGNPEEAAVILSRTALAGALYATAWVKCMDGTITGRGPSDKTLRNAWLKNHQPYSVKIGDKYYSYRRMEPFGTFLGLAADAHMVQLEVTNEEGTEAEDIGKAVFASLLANAVNKSYMQGLSSFMTAVDDQDLSSAGHFLGGVAGGFVPQAAQQFNTDVYYREAETILEEIYKRTPGLSDELLPKYSFMGEPVMKQGSLWNRNFSITRAADASPLTVEDRLVEDGIRLSPPPKKEMNGAVDYTDPRYTKNGKLPYVRWMELVAGGFDGEPGLRTKMETLMASDEYKEAKAGTATYPGGARGLMVAGLKDAHEDAAKQKMLDEYPDLQRAWEGAKGLRGAALEGGQAAVNERRALFGIPVP